jgi:hypothetical protein
LQDGLSFPVTHVGTKNIYKEKERKTRSQPIPPPTKKKKIIITRLCSYQTHIKIVTTNNPRDRKHNERSEVRRAT